MIACSIQLNSVLSPEDRARYQNTFVIQELLQSAKTIAIVGLSTEKTKASNMVAAYLQGEGYRIVPVNPKAESILGETCYPRLEDIPVPVDIVDVFRPAAEVPGIVDSAIRIRARALWLQLRIVDRESAARAQAAGLAVVMDTCIKMEHGRFSGALHWAGMNTEIISARRRR
jgi:hypothetical protein